MINITNLKPIKLLPARERVASALRKEILSRSLTEGDTISLEATAEMLGVSATPVREALQILSREGLIKLRQNKEALVQGVTIKTIRDYYEVRAVLEREAVIRVCRNNADLSIIETAHDDGVKCLKNNNAAGYGDFNQAFHMRIWTAADNERLLSMLSQMWSGMSMGNHDTEEGYAQLSTVEHKAILEAMQVRDNEKAGKLMHAHIIRNTENIFTHFDQ